MENRQSKRVISIIINYSDSSREKLDRGHCPNDRLREELDRIGTRIHELKTITGRKS